MDTLETVPPSLMEDPRWVAVETTPAGHFVVMRTEATRAMLVFSHPSAKDPQVRQGLLIMALGVLNWFEGNTPRPDWVARARRSGPFKAVLEDTQFAIDAVGPYNPYKPPSKQFADELQDSNAQIDRGLLLERFCAGQQPGE
jgi:hypothetical protein